MNRRYMPSLISMQCFEAAARHLSFTKAAEELNITQSAVSKQVGQLEAILATALFQRVRKRLQLTPEGSVYLTEVRKVLTQVEMSTRYMLSYGSRNEVLNVNTLPTFGVRWLMPRLNGFRFKHANLYLNISSRIDLFDFDKENIDIAFYYGRGNWPKARCTKLLDEVVVPVCSPDILPAEPLTSPLELTRMVLLQSSTRPEAWHDWYEQQGFHTEHSYHGPRFETFMLSIQAARIGCGVALVPRMFVEEELAEGKLVIPWHYAMTDSHNAYYIAVPEHAHQAPKVTAFMAWIQEKAPSLNAAP